MASFLTGLLLKLMRRVSLPNSLKEPVAREVGVVQGVVLLFFIAI